MGISVNGPSGIDTASIIEQLVELETTTKVTPIEEKVAAYEVSISAYSEMKSLINALSESAGELSEISDFNLFSTSSSNEDVATISGSTGCQAGTYSLAVYHTATSEKLASGNGLISSQTASLSSQGISTGTFTIDGTEIAIDDDDTLQDLRMKINNATDSDGNKLNVSATVLKASTDNYRLVLTSTESGETGCDYNDVNGSSVLQDLGIISSADGEKQIAYQQVTSDGSVQADLGTLSTGAMITISGKDHDGNSINDQIVVTENMTDEDFLQSVADLFHGTVTASFDDDGALLITDRIGGDSELEVSFDTFGTLSTRAMNCTTTGSCRENVLSCGSNAFFTIDTICMESESNTVDDSIDGVIINLYETTGDDGVELTIQRDVDQIVEKIASLVDSFNSLSTWVDEETSYAASDSEDSDDDTDASENGALVRDMTAQSIFNSIRSVFREQFTSVTGKYQNLNAIGISTDPSTGEFTIDEDKIKKALTDNFSDVVNLFTTNGTSETSGITLGRSSETTQSGTYELEKSGDTYKIRLSGSDTWYMSEAVTGEIAQFTSGPASGLSLTISEALADGETAMFNYSKGFGDLLESTCDSLTESSTGKSGMIQMRIDSLNNNIDHANDRIETLNTRIETYRERLIKQYAAMEEALSSMETQMSSMLSSLGVSSDS